jgi:hypothetical protein
MEWELTSATILPIARTLFRRQVTAYSYGAE